MRRRCLDPKLPIYKYYGARGISVDVNWRISFQAFYKDVGPRPSTLHTLERIDNNGNYESHNVKWATRKEQANNRRNRQGALFTLDNESLTLNDWADKVNIQRDSFRSRIKHGWSLRDAVSIPLLQQGRKIKEA